MWRDLLDKGKCALGFHVGDWAYERESACEQVRICSRCQTETRQTVHTWESWQYRASDSCEMLRNCSRCGTDERKTEHVWGDAAYEASGSCKTIRPCTRCHQTTPAGEAHAWDSWNYDDAESCDQTLTCTGCGQKGTQKRTQHDWGDWEQSEFYHSRVRVCRRCGDLVLDSTGAQSISLQTAARAVANVMEAKDPAVLRERITKNQAVLFNPVSEKYFEFAVDQLARDEKEKNNFREFSGVLQRCRNEGIESVFRPAPKPEPAPAVSSSAETVRAPSPPRGSVDAELVGHWLSNEPLGAGGSFTMATDTHCVLDEAGMFQWWSKSVSSFGVRMSPIEQGTWSTTGNTLRLQFQNGTARVQEFELSGNAMLWPTDGRYRLWQRTN